MVTLNRIYTKTGDAGTTRLASGAEVSKSDRRVEAYGSVDETNACLGLARAGLPEGAALDAMLARIQNELFDLGADLATPGEDFAPTATALRITAEQVARLEREIDVMNAELGPLRSFILPGGGAAAAHLHLARAVVRRAERAIVAAAGTVSLNPHALAFVNRLSDHLFVLARLVAKGEGGDVLWKPGATRGA
jgi:cob(I)alamin adenosyltransferase